MRRPIQSAVALCLALFLGACTLTPARFKQPLKTYAPAKPLRVGIVGFDYERFRVTSQAHASNWGTQAGSGNATAQGYGWQGQGSWRSSGAWGGDAHAVGGEYVTETLAPEVAAAFLRTGCFQVVAPNAPADYVFEGRAQGYHDPGARRVLAVIELISLTVLLGMPVWGKAEGQSSINVIRVDDGAIVHSFQATVPVEYSTTIYTFPEDNSKSAATARNFAIRDTIEQAAAAFCGRG